MIGLCVARERSANVSVERARRWPCAPLDGVVRERGIKNSSDATRIGYAEGRSRSRRGPVSRVRVPPPPTPHASAESAVATRAAPRSRGVGRGPVPSVFIFSNFWLDFGPKILRL